MKRMFIGPRGRTVKVRNPVMSTTRKGRLSSRLGKTVKSRARKSVLIVKSKSKPVQRKMIQNPGGIVTQSYFSSYKAPTFSSLVRKNASSPNYSIYNSPGFFECLSGFQGYQFFPLIRQVELQSILNALPAQQPAGNATRRFLLERVQANIVYTNASSASCTIDLYDITTKQDNDLGISNAWNNGIQMETVTPFAVNILGVKPWQSQQFKEFFKVIRTTHVNLAAGASHRHNINLVPNQVLKEQRIAENVNYAGLSYFTLAVVKGVPVCDDNDTPRLVSTAPITIDRVSEVNMKYRYISDIDTDLYITNNMVTLLQPEAMNVFQGQATSVTKAE